jgi:GWxTD domain-containing protein
MKARPIFAAAILFAGLAFAQLPPRETIDNMSPSPEKDGLLAAVHFYSALAFHKLGNAAKTDEELASFFQFQPKAKALDPKKYDRQFIATFNRVSKTAAKTAEQTFFDRKYPGFNAIGGPQPWKRPVAEWGGSPEMLYLGTPEEREEFARLKDDTERRAFIEQFWSRRDPTPYTPLNELRRELLHRVAFADYTFGTEEVRGSLSDRGKVFILLGKPKIMRVRPLTKADGATVARAERSVLEGTLERWVYSREQLPEAAGKRDAEFAFITEKGYGEGVLQRDFNALRVLGEAAKKPTP